MLQIIESIACMMIEYWAILLFVGIALRLELRQSGKYIVVYSIVTVMAFVVLAFLGQQEIFFVWIMLAEVLSVLLLFRGVFVKKIFAFYLSYMCYSIVSVWIQSLFALFYERSVAVLEDFPAHGIIFVIFAGVVVLYDKYRISETDGKGWYSFSTFALSTVTCIASCLSITMILVFFASTFWKKLRDSQIFGLAQFKLKMEKCGRNIYQNMTIGLFRIWI